MSQSTSISIPIFMKQHTPIISLILILIVFGGMLSSLSVMRYTAYNAAMGDLGNMSQAIWSATQGEPLVFTFENGNQSRLALHVEVIYFLLVPLYAIFPTPTTLLLVQSILFTAGAIPVFRLATRKLKNSWAGVAAVLIYLLYPVAQTAVLFDFHGDTLAMPLLAFAIDAWDRKSYRQYWTWIALALACKFYVAVPVAALGVVLILKGDRKVGTLTIISAIAWGSIAFFLIRQLFAPETSIADNQSTAVGYIDFYFSSLIAALQSSLKARLVTAAIVLLPMIWLGWRGSVWWIPAFAVTLPVLVSNGPGPSFYYNYHHYALAVPFLVVSVVEGATKLEGLQTVTAGEPVAKKKKKKSFGWKFWIWITVLFTAAFSSILVNTPLNLNYWAVQPGGGLDPNTYYRTDRDRLKDEWLYTNVPDHVALISSPFIAPHVINRNEIYSTRASQNSVPDAAYAIVDALFDHPISYGSTVFQGGVLYDREAIQELLQLNYSLIEQRDGLLLFSDNTQTSKELLIQASYVFQESEPPLIAQFDTKIGLLSSEVISIGGRKYLFRFIWKSIEDLRTSPPLFAVTRLEGPGDTNTSRLVHIPTMAILPTENWKSGQLVLEEFEVEIPEVLPAGEYQLLLSWYDSSNPYAYKTDELSQVGMDVMIGNIKLP